MGRIAERQVLSAAVARAAAGQAQLLLITGPSGIGKTRLVEELSQQARSAGAQVRCGESAPLAGAALAYGPFAAALGEQAGWLLDDGAAGDMLAARHRLFVRLLGLLRELATRAPLILVLEDLHWADDSSRELLAFLAVRLHQAPVLLAATLRDEDLDPGTRRWLAELERRPGVTRLRLTGLSDAEMSELVTRLLPDGSRADRLAAVVSAAGGNPLYARNWPWPTRRGRRPRSPTLCWPARPASPSKPGPCSTRSAWPTAGCHTHCSPRRFRLMSSSCSRRRGRPWHPG